MRKSSGDGEKCYASGSGLCVSGHRIELSKITRPPKSFTNRPVRLNQGSSLRNAQHQGRHSETDKRKVFKLNVTDCNNSEVCNKQLKQIYQTVEVDEFERILKEIQASDEPAKQGKRRRDVLDAIRADEIYEEFFGRYYDYLKNVMIKS